MSIGLDEYRAVRRCCKRILKIRDAIDRWNDLPERYARDRAASLEYSCGPSTYPLEIFRREQIVAKARADGEERRNQELPNLFASLERQQKELPELIEAAQLALFTVLREYRS